MIDFSLFGLQSRDKRVYEALLGSSGSSIRTLASLTHIHRGTVYESLKVLEKAGLVGRFRIGSRVKFVAESPEKLHELLREQRHRLLDAHSDVDAYITEIEPRDTRGMPATYATFFEGDEGMANILRDILTTCRLQQVPEYLAIASPRIARYLYTNYRHYTRERIAQKLRVRVIRQGGADNSPVALSESRQLPTRVEDTGCYTIIYGEKVAIISINETNIASGIIIANDGVARAYVHLFESLWGISSAPATGTPTDGTSLSR